MMSWGLFVFSATKADPTSSQLLRAEHHLWANWRATPRMLRQHTSSHVLMSGSPLSMFGYLERAWEFVLEGYRGHGLAEIGKEGGAATGVGVKQLARRRAKAGLVRKSTQIKSICRNVRNWLIQVSQPQVAISPFVFFQPWQKYPPLTFGPGPSRGFCLLQYDISTNLGHRLSKKQEGIGLMLSPVASVWGRIQTSALHWTCTSV